ncbi:hypothetical protein [Peribacillus acanthi]|uniref:YqgU-like beta propeller domain-containing protein n=1 Tax=Peribacillus acanthi TaxID=2171554 RepID=UPI000D3E6D70|nr:hypothetical protein [Peribacillus acanthi]
MRQNARFSCNKISICHFLCFLLCFFFITGCETKTGNVDHNKENQKKANQSEKSLSSVHSITLTGNEFFERSIDWLDDERLLFLASDGANSFLRSFYLFNGKIENILEIDGPIFDVSLDPTRKYLLIVQSPVANQMEISIFTVEGKKIYSATLPGVDLIHEWNYHEDGKVFVSSFYEDWTFRSYIINVTTNELDEYEIDHPFARWMGKEKLSYINWDMDNPSISAPLMSINRSGEKTKLLDSVVAFNVNKNVIVTVNEDYNQESAAFKIFDRSLLELASFSLPVLKGYSEWMVPFIEINESKKEIITLAPYKTALADTYKESFSLIQLNWQDGKKKVILDQVGFSNIACTPNWVLCLIGEQMETVVDINQGDQRKLYLDKH